MPLRNLPPLHDGHNERRKQERDTADHANYHTCDCRGEHGLSTIFAVFVAEYVGWIGCSVPGLFDDALLACTCTNVVRITVLTDRHKCIAGGWVGGPDGGCVGVEAHHYVCCEGELTAEFREALRADVLDGVDDKLVHGSGLVK